MGDEDMRTYALTVRYMHKQCDSSGWLDRHECHDPTMVGVIIKLPQNQHSSHPAELNPMVIEAVGSLDAAIAFTMTSEITATFFRQMSPYQNEILVPNSGVRIPVIDSLQDVSRLATTNQLDGAACIVKRGRFILVWSDSAHNLLPHGAELEKLLLDTIWGQSASNFISEYSTPAIRITLSSPPTNSNQSLTGESSVNSNEKDRGQTSVSEVSNSKDEKPEEIYDPGTATLRATHRPMILTHSFMVGLALTALVATQMRGVAQLIGEICIDGSYMRLLYLMLVPASSTLALFFATVVVACLFQFCGPVKDLKKNSRYNSAIAPNPARHKGIEYPHITIQIPVFKEALTSVIIPTITSIKAAIEHYESIGGTASIFVNEDGMQVVSEELARERQDYYATNNVGWCARPPNNKDGFHRKGRFKKASNMNYCLDFSIRVEDKLLELIADYEQEHSGKEVTMDKENELYSTAMEHIIASDKGQTWAAGNVRLGEFILLVDCDTRVPVDCLQLGALEMIESPDVAIIQHASGVMQVVHNMFENAITYLTNFIYSSIQYAVGSGDIACFVGHNAFLRWKAIQSVSFQEDGVTKFWSDSHVSEDFDQALRLQIGGFTIRLASYHNGEFKEGVSLTVFDELARWEKYAYGCNELLFNPLMKWPYKGPFTPILWRLSRSSVKSSSKVTILGYLFTYYAIAAAFPLCIFNYFLMGWIPDQLDHYYLDSFRIMIILLIVFNGISPIAYNYMLFRLEGRNFFTSMWETIKWMPILMVFFGGISIHLSTAILCHFFSINMEWNSTAKELEATGFFIGIDRIFKDFKYMYLIILTFTGILIYLGQFAPFGWTIDNWTIILPVANQLVCHSLLPLVLGLF